MLPVALLLGACGGELAAPEMNALDGGSHPPEAGRAARVVRVVDAGAVDRRSEPPANPIVLVHGFFGFDDFAGVEFADYFYGVRADLIAAGEPSVYTPALDPFNDSETRGRELEDALLAILHETGAERVNLIGHSQGGVDSRYVASMHPEWVASVTTISTPHRGTPLADIALRTVPDERFRSLGDRLTRLVGSALWDAADEETSVFAALGQLSTASMYDFNVAHPNQRGVRYFSVAGRTDRSLGGDECARENPPDFVAELADSGDATEPLLVLSESILDDDGAPNDGIVRVADARWGEFLGCIPADHFDEVGHLFGDSPGRGNDFEHRDFYRALVRFLREHGL